MTPAEQTMEMPTVARGGRRPGLHVLAGLAAAAVVAGGLGLSLRHDDNAPASSETAGASVTTAPEAADGPSASPTTQAPVTTTAAPATTAPPTTVPERLGPDSRLSLDGIGPVRIGMTLSEASAAAGVNLELLPMPRDRGCRYAVPDRSSGTGDELAFMVIDGRIARVDVGAMGPDRVRTVSGIGKGNTEAEVQATYPGRIRVEHHNYIPNGRNLVYVPADPALADRSMLFETVDGRVRTFRAGLAGAVGAPEGCS